MNSTKVFKQTKKGISIVTMNSKNNNHKVKVEFKQHSKNTKLLIIF